VGNELTPIPLRREGKGFENIERDPLKSKEKSHFNVIVELFQSADGEVRGILNAVFQNC
jgi:hypothetical protein